MTTDKARKLAISLLTNAIEASPEYTVSQVLHTILRKKSDPIPPYDWSDERLADSARDYIAEVSQNPQ